MSKPELELIGQDGNAFAIIGTAVRVAKRAGWSAERIEEFKSKATDGDYDHLLRICQDYFDII